MKFRHLLAAATCLALPLAAHAQPVTGPYVSLGAGVLLQQNVDSPIPEIGSPGETAVFGNSYNPGYATALDAGYGFGNGWRVQIGGNYDHNGASDTFETAHAGGAHETIGFPAGGGYSRFGVMANALYDFSVGLPVYPYLGAGVGYQVVNESTASDFEGEMIRSKSDGGRFAYDVIAGVAYPLAAVPGLSVTAEYRLTELLGIQRATFAITGGLNFATKQNDIVSHSFLVGLRYQLFNAPAMAPAPAPVAAPAPAEARTYLVFFDWDKYNLTPRATQIIAEAASDSKTQNTTTLDVSGYTDTSGTPVYNQGLSLRRAKAVAAKLVVDGVPAAEIEIHAYGETHLLVPTGPGVREPQNRRVEIVLN
jgi:outer membrane protein OmpA-like peptidoglycan-associated protein